jgi:hypothetical protein
MLKKAFDWQSENVKNPEFVRDESGIQGKPDQKISKVLE